MSLAPPRRIDIKYGEWNHPGTIIYRNLIQLNDVLYSNASDDEERMVIAESIVQALLNDQQQRRFFIKVMSSEKFDDDNWYVMDYNETCTVTLRELQDHHNNYNNNNKENGRLLTGNNNNILPSPSHSSSIFRGLEITTSRPSYPNDEMITETNDADTTNNRNNMLLVDLCCSASIEKDLYYVSSNDTIYDDDNNNFEVPVVKNNVVAVPCNHPNHHYHHPSTIHDAIITTTNDTDRNNNTMDQSERTVHYSPTRKVCTSPPPPVVSPSMKGSPSTGGEKDDRRKDCFNHPDDFPELPRIMNHSTTPPQHESPTTTTTTTGDDDGSSTMIITDYEVLFNALLEQQQDGLVFPPFVLDTTEEYKELKDIVGMSDTMDDDDDDNVDDNDEIVPLRVLPRSSGRKLLLSIEDDDEIVPLRILPRSSGRKSLSLSTRSTDSFQANLNNITESGYYDPNKHNYCCVVLQVPCDDSSMSNISCLTLPWFSRKITECDEHQQQQQQQHPLEQERQQSEKSVAYLRKKFCNFKRNRTNSGGTLSLGGKKKVPRTDGSNHHPAGCLQQQQQPTQNPEGVAYTEEDQIVSSMGTLTLHCSYSTHTSSLSSSSSWFRCPQPLIEYIVKNVTKWNYTNGR